MDAASALDTPEITLCVAQAAVRYRADGAQILALLKARGGRSGVLTQGTDGRLEVGIARIPEDEAAALTSNGITGAMLLRDDCLNVTIATYLIQRDALRARPTTPVSQGSRLLECQASAAQRYALPLDVFKAVLAQEGGWNGLKRRNSNGTFDLGLAQINTVHLRELAQYGVTEQQLVRDECVNLHVAAYRLRFEINRAGEFWRGVGNYHSRTPSLSQAYQLAVRKRMPQSRVALQ